MNESIDNVQGDSVQVQEGKKKRKVFIVAIIAAVAIILGASCYWCTQIKLPYDQAVNKYNAAAKSYHFAVSELEEKNSTLSASITSLQKIIDSDKPPLDEKLLTDASSTIGSAQGEKYNAPAMPKLPAQTSKINIAANDIKELAAEIRGKGDYRAVIATLDSAKSKLEKSIKQMEQVTNPSEQFVIKRLKGVPNITGVQAVTEDNDPNGKLNKQGGYTATVYFSSDLVDQSSVIGKGIVDKGTQGGGAVEVYRTADEAKARNTYLGAFDGSGLLNPGSHVVCGTVVIRTSDSLKASQQKEIEKNIREALLRAE